ncbi:hypothetical protein HOY80DRAFT_388851 [Tuber brumale]|nr:hypothetical protein HOY80DRAFT_388851 [Tuber brumale]
MFRRVLGFKCLLEAVESAIVGMLAIPHRFRFLSFRFLSLYRSPICPPLIPVVRSFVRPSVPNFVHPFVCPFSDLRLFTRLSKGFRDVLWGAAFAEGRNGTSGEGNMATGTPKGLCGSVGVFVELVLFFC